MDQDPAQERRVALIIAAVFLVAMGSLFWYFRAGPGAASDAPVAVATPTPPAPATAPPTTPTTPTARA
ncbi:hypothetical protein BH23ACT8_BH23ACT8_02840 [soil metagenome]